MDATTQALLLKTRKGATAAFETKQWGIVLTELGFTFQVIKTRNTVTEVKITSPLGHETLTITKQPNYRRISFYELGGWLKKFGFDLVETASVRLGLDTPEVEKKLKDLYVRDLTNTGTCPVCEGNFKRFGTGIGHHGFIRPGDGMLHGSCFGVGFLPWECSPQGAEAYLVELNKALKHAHEVLEGLPQRISLLKKVQKYNGHSYDTTIVEITRAVDSTEFERLLASEIKQTERRIDALNYDIKVFTAKVKNWKPDELPEVKYAGKFKIS